jgi:dsRNA-specific ribonuclease
MEKGFDSIRKQLIEQGLIKDRKASDKSKSNPIREDESADVFAETEFDVAPNDYCEALRIYCRAKGYLEPQYDIREVQGRAGVFWCYVLVNIYIREPGARKQKNRKHGATGIGKDPQEAKNNAAMNLLVEFIKFESSEGE